MYPCELAKRIRNGERFTVTTQDHREAFEKRFHYLDFRADDYGNYYSPTTLNYWYGWQAAMRYRDELEKGND